MNPLQQTKVVSMIAPAAIVNNTSATVTVVDTLGWDYLTAILHIGASDIAMTALMLKDSDDNSTNTEIAATDFSDNTQYDIDGTALALPSNTADGSVRIVHLDLRKHGRYIQWLATAGNGSTGTYLSSIGILSRGEVVPTTSLAMSAGTGNAAAVVVVA